MPERVVDNPTNDNRKASRPRSDSKVILETIVAPGLYFAVCVAHERAACSGCWTERG